MFKQPFKKMPLINATVLFLFECPVNLSQHSAASSASTLDALPEPLCLFPSHIVERVIRQYITNTQTLSNIPASPPSNSKHFFKLPSVGPFSIVAQNRLRKLLKRYCNNLDVKLAFSSFKIRNMFSVKDPVPVKLRSNVV